MPYQRVTISKAPTFGIVLKLTDVGELRPEDVPATYWRLLTANDRIDALRRIAAANNLLLERQHDPGVHRAIEEIFLRPTYRQRLASMQIEQTPHPAFPMAINRLGNLLTIKLLFSVDAYARFGILRRPLRWLRNTVARLRRAISAVRDRWCRSAEDMRNFTVGDLAVLSNEYTGSARIRTTKEIEPMDLLLEFLPRWEIDNRPDLAYSWSRMTRMLRHVQGNDATVVRLRSAINLDAKGFSFRGLSAEEFIAAAFAVYTQVRRIAPTDQTKCIIDVKTLSSELGMLPSIVSRFLRGTATSVGTYERLLHPPIGDAAQLRDYLATDAAATDVVLLRQRPIVRLSRRRFLVLDSHFVIELVASQMYWMIFRNARRRAARAFPRAVGAPV
jgi:hypothetical protein